MNKKIRANILILDFLKAEKVVKNVKSICQQKINFELNISVVDNSCNQKNANILHSKLQKYIEQKKCSVHVSTENIGYTKGNNLAEKKIKNKGEYIFILNPDIEIPYTNTFQKIIDYMDRNPRVGIVGPRQINEDGTYAMNVRQFPNFFLQIIRRLSLRNFPILRKKVEQDEMQKMDKAKTQEVDWLQSSFFVIRKKLWDEIGGFNEDYFLFMADSEMCLDVWKKGYSVEFFAETEVSADGIRCSAGGINAFFKSWVLRRHLKDAWKYFWKHVGEGNPRNK